MDRPNKKSSGKILIITEKFPNVIQPWLANTVAQIKKKGFYLQIISMHEGDKSYAKIIDDYHLRDHTITVRLDGFSNLVTIFKGFCSFTRVVNYLKIILRLDLSCRSYKNWSRKLVSRLSLASVLRDIDAQIVHSHFEISGYKILPIISAMGAKFVITFHGLPPPGVSMLSERARKEYVEMATIILVNTEFAKKQYVNLGADEKKIRILPQGTDLQIFTFCENRSRSTEKRGLSLLCVGRLSPDKGQEYVLEAVSYLKRDGVEFKLVIVGQGPDRARLEGLIHKYDIKGHVHIESGLSERQLVDKYHSADMFILASTSSTDGYHEETQGVAIQEAQACGALVIATKVGGIPECIVDGENAFLVNERSGVDIYKKILWLRENESMWDSWRANARRHVEEKYDIEKIGEKLSYVYSCLLANKNVPKSL